MAPAANLLVTALALAASADAFPTPNLEPFKTFLKRYYGDSNGLTRPPPLMDKRGLLPSGWSYAGCGTESHFQRLLQGFSFRSKVNTPTMCMNECAKRGFTIAGTEFADECYCGNAFTGSGGVVVPDSFCAMPCAGDHGEKCGSAWYLSLYTYNVTAGELYCSSGTKTATVETPKATPTTTTTTQTTKSPATTPTTTTATSQPTTTAVHRWSPLGCALDNVNGVRVLSGFNQLNVPDMTPEACQKTCAAKGFSYAGVEDGDECWCGSSLAGTVKWDSSLCQKPCAGNSGTTCGGLWALQVYELSNSAGSVTKTPAVPTTILTATPHPDTTTTNNAPPTMTTRSIPQSQEQHYVWAHYMVGNTFTYFQSDWADDIAKAKAQGIDGFALNVGSEFWEPNRVQAAYRAAEAAGDFKLFLSLDMTSLGCGSTPDANGLVSLVQSVASSPAQARINGKVLVSTFAGEQCTFGTGSVTAWKTLFKDRLAGAGLPVDFMPAFFVDPTSFASYDWIDGYMSWNGAWPMGDYSIETNSLDAKYVSAVGSSKAYMTTVSPFFFTHFGKATWNKNWIYRSDDWLYCTRWEQIIATRDKSIMTEIVTWNDYGESTYIGPIKGMLPITSNSWVDGFPHTGLATLTSYYATAFKTGAYPAITKDTITMWSRPHPASANALVDIVGRPTNWQWTDDNLYAVVLATAPATVTLYSGSTSQTFNVQAGLSKLKIPSAVGGIGGTITRGGATVASYSSGSDFQYTLHPMSYNYNYFVGSSA